MCGTSLQRLLQHAHRTSFCDASHRFSSLGCALYSSCLHYHAWYYSQTLFRPRNGGHKAFTRWSQTALRERTCQRQLAATHMSLEASTAVAHGRVSSRNLTTFRTWASLLSGSVQLCITWKATQQMVGPLSSFCSIA
jgi:hypothetical protein